MAQQHSQWTGPLFFASTLHLSSFCLALQQFQPDDDSLCAASQLSHAHALSCCLCVFAVYFTTTSNSNPAHVSFGPLSSPSCLLQSTAELRLFELLALRNKPSSGGVIAAVLLPDSVYMYMYMCVHACLHNGVWNEVLGESAHVETNEST